VGRGRHFDFILPMPAQQRPGPGSYLMFMRLLFDSYAIGDHSRMKTMTLLTSGGGHKTGLLAPCYLGPRSRAQGARCWTKARRCWVGGARAGHREISPRLSQLRSASYNGGLLAPKKVIKRDLRLAGPRASPATPGRNWLFRPMSIFLPLWKVATRCAFRAQKKTFLPTTDGPELQALFSPSGGGPPPRDCGCRGGAPARLLKRWLGNVCRHAAASGCCGTAALT